MKNSPEKWPKTTAFRSGVARGLDKDRGKVDRDTNTIHGLAVITEGEAKGHGVHIEACEIEKVVDLGNAMPSGLKSRFGHPNMSSTALGTYMGREKNFYVDKSSGVAVARADAQLSEAARKSPGFAQDPVDYLLTLAEKEPDKFGTSIVFTPGNPYRRNKNGDKVYPYNPDGNRNEEFRQCAEPTFIEIARLHANDFVDEPAANPDGLFTEGNEPLAAVATKFLDEHPEMLELLKEGDVRQIVTGFLARYAESSGKSVAIIANAAGEFEDVEILDASVVCPDQPHDPDPNQLSHKPASQKENLMAEHTKDDLKRYKEAFGASGLDYLIEGLSFEQAQAKHAAAEITALTAKTEKLQSEIESKDAQIAEKDKELSAAKAELELLKKGAKPAPPGDNPSDEDEEQDEQLDANKLAEELVSAGKAKSLLEAYPIVFKKHPELDPFNKK